MTTDAQQELRQFRDQLERALAELIAPELAAEGMTSVYVVLGSELLLPSSVKFGGITCEDLGEILRPAIGARWRGAGPTVLVCDQLLMSHFGGDLEMTKLMVGTWAVHELAHVVDRDQLCATGSGV